ncbi:DUF6912 family protein [Actinorhabdospora filicis]|uniref:DUF6912 family protein n=1 Tax=Actinorhabdospora filicis TaxID=1785913 RepID=UPI002554587C|nr:hypothetical protein [Actinorhabdospora filicis]
MTRIYLPATTADLAALHATGELAAREGYAVTDALRAAMSEDGRAADEELCEFAVFTAAAYASVARIKAGGDAVARRVVVSVDLPEVALRKTGEDGVYATLSAVPLGAVAAIHVDEESASALVAKALEEDEPSEATADSLDDLDLEWYDPSELDVLSRQW